LKCYLIRHGRDDDNVRGGWSQASLTDEGKEQSLQLAKKISDNSLWFNIKHIFSSDLPRAMQTAKLISDALNLSVNQLEQFREVNNGIFPECKMT